MNTTPSRRPPSLPKWVLPTPSVEEEIRGDWAQSKFEFEKMNPDAADAGFGEALEFNPTPEQVRDWVAEVQEIRGCTCVRGGGCCLEEDEMEMDEGMEGGVESDLEIESESESESESAPEDVGHPPIRVEPSAHTSPSPSLFSNAPTPGNRRRTHASARKFFLAFLHSIEKVECAITLRDHLYTLVCTHLVPQSTKNSVTGKIEWAVGGRFCINSRVNYILLSTGPRAELGWHGVLIYPTQRVVLDAVDRYLTWLDGKDGGTPWNRETLVDYWSLLRKAHPILSDGHQYSIRYIAIQDQTHLPRRARLEVLFQEDNPYKPYFPPYTDFPTVTTFANPIFVMLNAMWQLECVYSVPWEERRTEGSWAEWIRGEPRLGFMRTGSRSEGGAEAEGLDVEFAAFMNVAAHLRRRLGKEFEWKFKPPSVRVSEYLSSDSDYGEIVDETSIWSSDIDEDGGGGDEDSRGSSARCGSTSAASVIAAEWRAKNLNVKDAAANLNVQPRDSTALGGAASR